MKHLKYIFENTIQDKSQEDKSDVEDICLELSDVGFDVMITSNVISKYINKPYIRIKVTVTKPKGEFTKTYRYPEIKEVVERLKDCLSDYTCQVIVQFGNTISDLDNPESIIFSGKKINMTEIKNGNIPVILSQIIFTN